MFAARYFCNTGFAPRYFPKAGASVSVSVRRSRYLQHVARLRFDIVTGKPIREPLTQREIENEILALFLAE